MKDTFVALLTALSTLMVSALMLSAPFTTSGVELLELLMRAESVPAPVSAVSGLVRRSMKSESF